MKSVIVRQVIAKQSSLNFNKTFFNLAINLQIITKCQTQIKQKIKLNLALAFEMI